MSRLSDVSREELKPEDQQYFDEIVGSRGSVRGPYGVLLHSPQLAAGSPTPVPSFASTLMYRKL